MAVSDGQPLSDTAGAVLDPVFSLRRRLRLAPGATAQVTFWTLVASSRDELLDLVDKHHDAAAFDRASTLAWDTSARSSCSTSASTWTRRTWYQRLAGHLLYANLPRARPSSEVLARSRGRA